MLWTDSFWRGCRLARGRGSQTQVSTIVSPLVCFPSIHDSIFVPIPLQWLQASAHSFSKHWVSIAPALLKELGNTSANKRHPNLRLHGFVFQVEARQSGGVAGGGCCKSGLWTEDLAGTAPLGGETRARPRPGLQNGAKRILRQNFRLRK